MSFIGTITTIGTVRIFSQVRMVGSPFEKSPSQSISREPLMLQPLMELVSEVAVLLRQTSQRIVFAESCTGGLVSASLARVPGISDFLCGSAVVYRLDTKSRWLGISESLLRDPGPVSEVVAREMAVGCLSSTPEADFAVSITGHLGPGAPANLDGLILIGIARRGTSIASESMVHVFEHRLASSTADLPRFPGSSVREQRQWLTTEWVLNHLRNELAKLIPDGINPAKEP